MRRRGSDRGGAETKRRMRMRRRKRRRERKWRRREIYGRYGLCYLHLSSPQCCPFLSRPLATRLGYCVVLHHCLI